MIDSYEKFRISDENKAHDFFVEVNWKKDKSIENCQLLKVTFPDGQQAFVKKDILFAFLFAIGGPKEQRAMIPQQVTRVKWYETVVGVKATKDIRKGETITFPIKLSIPVSQEEIIGDANKFKKAASGLVLPSGAVVK